MNNRLIRSGLSWIAIRTQLPLMCPWGVRIKKCLQFWLDQGENEVPMSEQTLSDAFNTAKSQIFKSFFKNWYKNKTADNNNIQPTRNQFKFVIYYSEIKTQISAKIREKTTETAPFCALSMVVVGETSLSPPVAGFAVEVGVLLSVTWPFPVAGEFVEGEVTGLVLILPEQSPAVRVLPLQLYMCEFCAELVLDMITRKIWGCSMYLRTSVNHQHSCFLGLWWERRW